MTKWKKQKRKAQLAVNDAHRDREEEEDASRRRRHQQTKIVDEEEHDRPEEDVDDDDPVSSAHNHQPAHEDGVEHFSGGEEDDDEKAEKKKKKSGGFQSMNLSRNVFQGVFKKGYRLPTPIQRRAIPKALAGHDVVAMARTGSGKTAAFLIPLFEKLQSHSTTVGVRAVILSPTRELATQTLKFFKELGRFMDLRAALIVGGDNMDDQFAELARNPDVLIATPGRLLHHCVEAGLSLKSVTYLVFDEADRLFEMGFENDLRELLAMLPSEARQTLLFSATMPKKEDDVTINYPCPNKYERQKMSLAGFVKAGLKDPVLIRLDTEATLSDHLSLVFFLTRLEAKPAALVYLFKHIIPEEEQTVVFVATRHHVEFLHQLLTAFGISSTSIYGSMDQTARKQHLLRFRKKQAKVLVVTDVAARGIDIPLLDNVVNYDFPLKPKLFVHRAGRTARQNMSGTAYSLVSAEELAYMVDLHLFLGRPLKNSQPPGEKYNKKGSYYGSIPQSLLDAQDELVREIVSRSVDLESAHKVMLNAYKMYWKVAQNPSPESVRRAKELPPPQPHPHFVELGLPADEKASTDFLEKLRAFRPQLTVIEMAARNTRTLPGKPNATDSGEVMRRKRAMHEPLIQSKKRQNLSNYNFNKTANKEGDGEDASSSAVENVRYSDDAHSNDTPARGEQTATVVTLTSSDGEKLLSDDLSASSSAGASSSSKHDDAATKTKTKTKKRSHSFVDKEFFMDYQPKDHQKEKMLELDAKGTRSLDDMVLDLGASDEKGGLEKHRSKLQWDRKKKKYVRVQQTAGGKGLADINSVTLNQKKKLMNEAGKKITAPSKIKAYDRWTQRTKLRIPSVGERELSLPPLPKRRRGFPAPNVEAKDELKNVDQLRKEKIRQERMKEQNRPKKKSSSNSKGGRGAGSNKNKGKASSFSSKKKFGGGGGGGGSKKSKEAMKSHNKLPATKLRKNRKK